MTHLTTLLHTTAITGYASRPLDPVVEMFSVDTITKRSRDSAAMLPYWDKTDTVIGGIDALRLAGTTYLPKFPDETDREYQYRLQCTKVTNVYNDIVEGLTSKPFEYPVQVIDAPEQITEFSWDVDGSGNNLTSFAATTFFNGINSAIDWIMVDFDKKNPAVRSIADAKREKVRPYWSHVIGRNVLDVRSKMIGGSEVLTFIRIFEPGSPDRVREYKRTDAGVTWTLYEKTETTGPDGKTQYARIDGGTLGIDVIPLIPFITGRRDGRNWTFKPALKDAVDLQIELYQQESGLKFIKTMSAYPMLAANGINPPVGQDGKPDKRVQIGPARMLWSSMDASGKVGSFEWVEPSSENLKFLADDVASTIQQLRELGRQPLTAQSGNITVITAAVAAGKAKSAVKAWAYGLKDALENALNLTARWMNVPYESVVHVFVDFDDWMEADDLSSLDADRDRGDISQETLWEEKKRRGVYSSDFTAERERERLLGELPRGNTPPDMTT